MLLNAIIGSVIVYFISELYYFLKVSETLKVSKQYIYYYLLSKNANNVSLEAYYSNLVYKLLCLYGILFIVILLLASHPIKYGWIITILILLVTAFVRFFNRKMFLDQFSIMASMALKDRSSQN